MTDRNAAPTGYPHPDYAASLVEFGRPRQLPRCGGWLLERAIPGSARRDAMGCYPLFACRDWTRLGEDLEELRRELVSVTLVPDPLGAWDEGDLRRWFPVLHPFKEHFIVELDRPLAAFVSQHHKRYARRALQDVSVTIRHGDSVLEPWLDLYAQLVRRHAIRGIPAFSRTAFERQLAVPGLTAFVAGPEEHPLGILLWYVQGRRGYYHLGAYSEEGYARRAAFALFWRALEHFQGIGLERLTLGGAAGTDPDESDGLARFKRGWCTSTRQALLCGRVLDEGCYRELSQAFGTTDFFPAYRRGEFT